MISRIYLGTILFNLSGDHIYDLLTQPAGIPANMDVFILVRLKDSNQLFARKHFIFALFRAVVNDLKRKHPVRSGYTYIEFFH